MKKLPLFIFLFIVIVVLSFVFYNLYVPNKLIEKENTEYQLEVKRIQDNIRELKKYRTKY